MIARRRDHLFTRALVISLLFHLSAVTLFRIVFRFPHKDTEYFSVAIVEKSSPPAAVVTGEKLSVAGPDFSAAAAAPRPLPDIQLPALQFKEFSKLRMRQEALDTRSRFDEYFAGGADDLWAQARSRFSALGQTLSRLTFGATDIPKSAPSPVSRPAPGFEAYVDWASEPRDRKVLTVVPVGELWGVSPSDLPEPVTLSFSVFRSGKVEKVVIFSPIDDPKHYADASARALAQYRFERLLGDGPPTQSGTFIVRASTSETP